MDKIKKNFGFGMMRLPGNGAPEFYDEITAMIDYFMVNGFNYFDTARPYGQGKSEIAIGKCLSERYPRESFFLTDKLTSSFYKTEEELRPLFESQLEATKVDYFDLYLLHAQNAEKFETNKKLHVYEFIKQLKEEGKVRHIGMSFHDTADVLDKILTEWPDLEVVQLQFNYLDYESESVQSKACYDVCVKHNKKVIVMEPLRGGRLARLYGESKEVLDKLGDASYASYGIRFAASHENVMMVLSGMSTLDQVKDNVSFMKEFKPLNEEEFSAVKKVADIINSMKQVPCTACHYCTDGCPQSIDIPEIFKALNMRIAGSGFDASAYYKKAIDDKGKASDCIECGQCEKECPQGIKVREFLKYSVAEFEN